MVSIGRQRRKSRGQFNLAVSLLNGRGVAPDRQEAREWLEKRAKELRDEVRRSEDEIARYRVKKGLVEGMHARLDTEQISLLTEDLVHSRNTLAAPTRACTLSSPMRHRSFKAASQA